jgi:2-polyprenyl-6-methoxyphenol hydroxylase-like FAD-dependent oxidoreductase
VLNHLSAEGRRLTAEVGAPIIGIHRATLHEILLDRAGRDNLHLGRSATRYEVTESGVRVHFSDSSVVEADALIGADGIHSICREQLVGDGEPIYSGYFCWRGIAPSSGALPNGWGGEIWGEGVRFGGCCIDGGRCYWFVVADGPAGQKDMPGQSKATVLEKLKEFNEDIRSLIASTPEEAIFRSDIADRKPITTWGEGRLTLLGDAAHAMTPNLGQGACQAIEDALVLGLQFNKSGDVRTALRSYEKLRQPRANKVVEIAHMLGEIGQWHNPVATFLRNGLFRLMPNSLMRSQLAEAWKMPYGGFDD